MGLLSRAKAALARKAISKAMESIDTAEERNIMADEAKKNGVPAWAANLLSLLGGIIVAAVQDVASGGNFVDLFSNPKALVAAVVSAILIRVAHSLNPPKA